MRIQILDYNHPKHRALLLKKLSNRIAVEEREGGCVIEFNHFRYEENKEPDYDLAEQTAALAEEIDEKLSPRAKESWRWRILYIRALLDHMRFAAYRQSPWAQRENGLLLLRKRAGNLMIENQEAQKLMMELQNHYCCAPFNGENHHTMPPVGGMKLPGDVYNPTLT